MERLILMTPSMMKSLFNMQTNSQAIRGSQANKHYWGVIVKKATEHYNKKPVDFIDDLFDAIGARLPQFLKESIAKLLAIVRVTFSEDMVHALFKMKFNKSQSTTKNTVSRMAEYSNEIWEHFYHEHNNDLNAETN